MIAIPIVTLLLLLWLRQLEVNALRQRAVSNYGSVPEFQLINQDGRDFGSADLRGKIWIADFIYSTCPGPVSDDQQPDERIAKAARKNGCSPGFVHRRSGKRHTRGLAHLCGKIAGRTRTLGFSDRPPIDHLQFSRNGFKLAVSDGSDAQGIPVHSTRMILVDRHGEIRGYYDAAEADAVTKLVADTTPSFSAKQPK